MWAVNLVPCSGALVRQVEGLFDSVLFDLDGSESILLGSACVWVEELLLAEGSSAKASESECGFHLFLLKL